ncbi:MAG: glycosyltransferase family 39 protein [Proteobacteria bacterium]|nr:glycosyltransferase family 39 protein [Pseudomonadota bacterium]
MKRPWVWLVIVIVLMAFSNLLTSSLVGLGDAEALYYCYGQHLSLSYLDHPPLIGWLNHIAVSLGGTSVFSVRAVSVVLATLSIVFTYLLTKEIFGARAGAWSAILLLGTPVFAIGMTASTPDAPLAALWPLFTWQLHRALVDSRLGIWSRFGRPILLGLLLGLAFLAKYTGFCLALTALIVVLRPEGRIWLKRPGFWLGASMAAAVSSPIVIWNARHDWAGLLHRLVWTQKSAGFSLGNAGALLGGQLLYVGPLMLGLLAWACFHIWRNRHIKPEPLTLLAASFPALAITYLIVLWSDVAEPHWPAAGYLPLFAAAAGFVAEIEGRVRKLARFAVGYGVSAFALLHVLVLTPLLPVLSPQDSYRPEYDLGNELRGWPEAADAIRALNREGKPVLAAFYTQCSQLEFVLSRPGDPEVRCISKETDDFDIWHGQFVLPQGGALFVTDNRFDHDPQTFIPEAREHRPPITVEITRGGRWVRRFKIFDLRPKNEQ